MKKKHFKDIRGLIFKAIRKSRLKASSGIWSFLMIIYCFLKDVKIGKKNTFYGRSHFNRNIHSAIKIGNNNVFRSTILSNLAGISHICTIGTVREGAVLEIGNHCGFSGVSIGAAGSVKIHDYVLIGANTFIADFDGHSSNPDLRHVPLHTFKPVEIKSNVFIGYGTTVLKGVTIGENSVIAANSLVIGDIPPNVIAAGSPCRVITKIKTTNETDTDSHNSQ